MAGVGGVVVGVTVVNTDGDGDDVGSNVCVG